MKKGCSTVRDCSQMKVKKVAIRNFRRLRGVSFSLHDKETIFVGPNNSGKTSAANVFRRFFVPAPKFSIHDFSIELLNEFDQWAVDRANNVQNLRSLPEIGLDVWFTIDPENIPYAKLGDVITSLSGEVTEIGIGCTYKVNDVENLWENFDRYQQTNEQSTATPSLSQFLTSDEELKRHFAIQFEALSVQGDEVVAKSLTTKEGKELCKSLLRVDFVDAQRFLQDEENNNYRGSKLSSVFASFYNANFKRVASDREAENIVVAHNRKLTDHYKIKFSDLMIALQQLGFPSANERQLSVVSKLTTDEALRGTTDIEYIEVGSDYSLPEASNGLGTKNLILIAIQLLDYQLQCSSTVENQPQCHLIFIEEPEVHLHPQAQQTFTRNMWSVLNKLKSEDGVAPQLVITTHSSHIANSGEFDNIRYFRRCPLDSKGDNGQLKLDSSEIKNLGEFNVAEDGTDALPLSPIEVKKFLQRYMTLSYCDLFFADGAIFVEGTSERILLPEMISRFHQGLESAYISILEVGGAHAHIFRDLLKFLRIPYLVITDLDSVKETSKAACVAGEKNAITSNPSLKSFFADTKSIADFQNLSDVQKTQECGDRYVTFQKYIDAEIKDCALRLLARTFEEDLIYTNLKRCGQPGFLRGIKLPDKPEEINAVIYDYVRERLPKKAEFALSALADEEWNCPAYIKEGLDWLAVRLRPASSIKESNYD